MFGNGIIDDDSSLSVQPTVLLALFVSRSDSGDDFDWVESAVLGQGVGDYFESSSEIFDDDAVDSSDLLSVDFELLGDFDFRCTSSWNDRSVFDQASDNAEGVVERPFSFVENEHVGSSDQDAERLRVSLAAGDLEDFRSVAEANVFDFISFSELLRSQLIDVSDWDTADRLR